MHFHDCFIRGCDGSVLLSSTKKNQAEKDAIPNQTLRGFNVIDAVKSALEKKCPGVVSCSDILALVARDAVLMIGGPHWDVPTGRRDGRVSIANEALFNLPSPFANITVLKQQFSATGLSVKDLAGCDASGGPFWRVPTGRRDGTISRSSEALNNIPPPTSNFTNLQRLFANQGLDLKDLVLLSGKGDADPSLDPRYVAQLKKRCKPGNSNTVVEMDPGSFNTFDEDYYSTIVAKRRGLFQSDSALLDDAETRDYVRFQSRTQGSTFAQDFAESKGGPFWRVPTGRRDGTISRSSEALNNIPPPTSNFTNLQRLFANQGLDLKDLVLLSGAHTIGVAHCSSFSNRLYNFTGVGDQDPALDSEYAANLKARKCRSLSDNTTIVEMDPGSFRTFDLSYYSLLLKRRGLFQSDSALTTNSATLSFVNQLLQGPLQNFFGEFANSMEKMGRVNVKTGTTGEIRKHCAFVNS
ncbi:hypothetical protein NC652_019657 [Populus alba x Populus x berolinensis]|nr:hypothetical protein NC652_019657 [Populus alba x Populus x berolinensis]